MKPSNDIAERPRIQRERELARLDWYDMHFDQSLATCEAATLGVIWAMIFIAIVISAYIVFATQTLTLVAVFISILLLLTMLCIAFAKVVVATLNFSTGFAMSARVQVALTGGLAGFLSVSPICAAVTNSGTLTFLAIVVATTNFFAVMMASRPATWHNWAIKKTIAKKTRRPQLRLKHAFSLTACFAAICSVATISKEVGIAIGTFVTLQAVLLLIDATWVWSRSAATDRYAT